MEQCAKELLHNQHCPHGYKCQAVDCMECLQIYADGKEESNG